MGDQLHLLQERIRAYFVDQPMTFWVAALPCLVLAALLYTRSFGTNFIFDEQEALLANPYVNGKNLRFIDVVHRDFWGLPADRSVGSYRPLPNVLWRAIAELLRGGYTLVQKLPLLGAASRGPFALNPWVFHWVTLVLHAVNGAILTCIVHRVVRKRDVAWLSGIVFTACAVLTEAVSGIVGTADVLGGLGALLALAALALPLWAMPFGVFLGLLVGLFSKESAIVCVPLVPLAALWLAPYTHAGRPRRALRAGLSLVATTTACVLYVTARKRWFPTALPADLSAPLAPEATSLARAFRAFLVWFRQPSLPRDPLNNPLVDADTPHRIAGALRVWWRALSQLVFPKTLSGDYSFRAEPVPEKLFFLESVLGGLAMILPIVGGLALWGRALWLEHRVHRARRATRGIDLDGAQIQPLVGRLSGPPGAGSLPPRSSAPWDPETAAPVSISVTNQLIRGIRAGADAALVAMGLVWLVVSYFPHSNIPLLLPTVRAERFLYFPAIGSSVVLGVGLAYLVRRRRPKWLRYAGPGFVAAFLAFQCLRARIHAFDYADDLVFWGATKDAVPDSAKAHLNYSVMWGARSRLDIRLKENRIAAELAPRWPMAHIYLGDTLCRLHRSAEAWSHYVDGFKLAENEPNLIALALQCLWDEKGLLEHEDELLELAGRRPGSWLDYLIRDILDHGEEHNGVDPKYRPRGYNEGPKD